MALFRTVCGAVQYAHQNLVVHRDIKPANVLVDGHGVPKLLDFGIAKLLASGVDPDLAPTATVLPMMTPEYASPEQVKGQTVTTASDVYSLGVLLYELLAGRRPYEVRTDSLEAIVQAVCQTEPRAPSEAVRRPVDATATAARPSCAATWTRSSSRRCARSPSGAIAPPTSCRRTSGATSKGFRSPPGRTRSATAPASSCAGTAPRWRRRCWCRPASWAGSWPPRGRPASPSGASTRPAGSSTRSSSTSSRRWARSRHHGAPQGPHREHAPVPGGPGSRRRRQPGAPP